MPTGPVLSAAAFAQIHVTSLSTWTKSTFALVDSGATDHVVNNKSFLHDYKPFSRYVTVAVGDGHNLHVHGYGTLIMHLKDGTFAFKNTLYVPSLKCNILSVSGMSKSGYTSVFNDRGVCIFLEGGDNAIPVLKQTY